MNEVKFKGRRSQKVMLTDAIGHSKIFNDIIDAAKYLECSKQSLYNAISKDKKIRGCIIKYIPLYLI